MLILGGPGCPHFSNVLNLTLWGRRNVSKTSTFTGDDQGLLPLRIRLRSWKRLSLSGYFVLAGVLGGLQPAVPCYALTEGLFLSLTSRWTQLCSAQAGFLAFHWSALHRLCNGQKKFPRVSLVGRFPSLWGWEGRGTCTASSKDKTIQLLTPQWHGFKSRTWWLLSSPAVSACSYKIAEGSTPKPGNACGAAVSCRKEDTLAFKQRLESLESMQGNRDPTKGNSPRHPPPCRWGWNAIRRNRLGKGAGGRCPGCAAGLCSGLSVSLAKWHFFFSFLSNL